MSRPGAAAVVVVAAAYAWWATGLHPFRADAYVAVGVAAIAVGVVVAVAPRSPRPHRVRRARGSRPWLAPWALLLVAAVVLESAGLALGGRSRAVPTLSTTVDHLLATHAARWLLFLAWLAVGTVPAWRALARRRGA